MRVLSLSLPHFSLDDFRRADAEQRNVYRDLLQGLHKASSVLQLAEFGLPASATLFILQWSAETRETVERFAQDLGAEALLLRHDKRRESPPYPRGGYLVNWGDFETEALRYLRNGRIVFFLEPLCPL